MLLGHTELIATLQGFGSLVRRDEAMLNALNVFPVADSDTGTNLCRTLHEMVAAIEPTSNLAEARRSVATSALSGRGNSGLIIGQFLTGFVEPLSEPADAEVLVACLSSGSNAAWRAVAKPVQGTVLSVAAAVARDARVNPASDIVLVGVRAEVSALQALEKTPSQLAVLARAGVVDSGGAGLVLFFEALAAVLKGAVLDGSAVLNGQEVRAGQNPPPPGSFAGGAGGATGTVVGYEIQFRVMTTVADAGEMRSLLGEIGSDVVLAEADGELSVHVHVSDDRAALEAIETRLEGRTGASAIKFDVEPLIESNNESA